MEQSTETKAGRNAEERELEGLVRGFLADIGYEGRRDELIVYHPDVVPKPARVVSVAEPEVFGTLPGEDFTLRGKKRVPIDTVLGKRTVYLPEPVSIGGDTYYLEAKGYGRNGKELYGSLFYGEDPNHGMFMDSAFREYYYPLSVRSLGFEGIQRPVALLRFDTDEFMRSAFVSLWVDVTDDMARELDDYPEGYRRGSAVVLEGWESYRSAGREGIRRWAKKHGITEDKVAALTDGRAAGYVLRAVRSPFRVGDLRDPDIVTNGNKRIAARMGDLTRRLLEQGFWNLSPNPGNWTRAGELVDFEDIIRVPDGLGHAEEDRMRRKIPSLRSHLMFTFGEGTTGLLSPEFREGFAGEPASDPEVAVLAERILTEACL